MQVDLSYKKKKMKKRLCAFCASSNRPRTPDAMLSQSMHMYLETDKQNERNA